MMKCLNGKMVECTPEEEAKIRRDQEEMTARMAEFEKQRKDKAKSVEEKLTKKYKISKRDLRKILDESRGVI